MGWLGQTTTTDTGGSGLWVTIGFVYLAFFVLYVIGAWKMYEKAGEPGWKCVIPFYNIYILLKIVGRPGWWLILWLIPFVSIVIWIIVSIDLAKSFGKGTAFAVGLVFLGPIFVMILGFGPARYLGAAGPEGGTMSPPPPMPA
jgi:hypothetical protein